LGVLKKIEMSVEKIFKGFDLEGLKAPAQRRGSRKISERVFDEFTIKAILKLKKKGAFDTVEQIVSQGKEANVYYGTLGGEGVALKIYCYETSDFKNMGKYVRGDPRFPDWRSRRQLITLWAQKEYKNLMRVQEKVACPVPIGFLGNVLVMSFVGSDGIPAPTLNEVPIVEHPRKYFKAVVGYMQEMYSLRLVHGDLSEYNIMDVGSPVLIDFSAGVLLDHPEAFNFLQRDVNNVVRYFQKQGVECDAGDVLKQVVGE